MYKEIKCKNCGASLTPTSGKRTCVCNFCRTTYHLDDLGRIEEYKVKIDVMGKIIEFYIETIEVVPNYVETTLLCDDFRRSLVVDNEIRLSLIGRG